MNAYREIPLSQGKVAIVDVCDYELLSQWKWFAFQPNKKIGFYAGRWEQRKRLISMHRLLMGLDYGDRRLVDHKNRNPLDNRRENLRLATRSQNQYNRGLQRNNTSGYKGIHWTGNRWEVFFESEKVKHYVGRYVLIEEAQAAYKAAIEEVHGEFARTV